MNYEIDGKFWIHYDQVKCFLSESTILLAKKSHALLFKNEQYVIKMCKVQKFPKDYYRKYFGKSQANREYLGAKILNSLNISTPTPIATSFNFLPWGIYESLYVMEYLEGYQTIGLIDDKILLKKIIPMIARDLLIMKEAKIIYKDLHLENIMYLNSTIKWIDTDIKIINDTNEFNILFKKSFNRLLKPLSDDLKEYFRNLIVV